MLHRLIVKSFYNALSFSHLGHDWPVCHKTIRLFLGGGEGDVVILAKTNSDFISSHSNLYQLYQDCQESVKKLIR